MILRFNQSETMSESCYENYPLHTVFLSNLLPLSIYIIGAYIISTIGIIYTLLYLFYCLFLEIRLLKKSCTNCYYYGKVCGFGKGKLSALFFERGNNAQFSQMCLTWKDLLPDLLVSILPLLAGIISLIYDFTWPMVILILILLALSMGGNALVRGYLTCGKCKQRELGCPAEELFNK